VNRDKSRSAGYVDSNMEALSPVLPVFTYASAFAAAWLTGSFGVAGTSLISGGGDDCDEVAIAFLRR